MSQTILAQHTQKDARNSTQSRVIPSKDSISCKQNPPAAICTHSSEGLRMYLLFISPRQN